MVSNNSIRTRDDGADLQARRRDGVLVRELKHEVQGLAGVGPLLRENVAVPLRQVRLQGQGGHGGKRLL
jgi:hypothetical protein